MATYTLRWTGKTAVIQQLHNWINPSHKDGIYGALDCRCNRVERIYAVGAECLFPSKSHANGFTGLSREQLERYGESPKEGTWDYDELVRQNGILLKAEDATFLSREFGFTAQVGEKVPVLCGMVPTVEFTVMGIFQKPPRNIASGSMILVPDELLPVLDSSIDNYTSDMIIYVDEETDQNRREIFALHQWNPLACRVFSGQG